MMHSANGFSAKDARESSNALKVKQNLTMKGRKNRVYPETVGDEAKIFRKRKPNEKERESSYNIYWTKGDGLLGPNSIMVVYMEPLG